MPPRKKEKKTQRTVEDRSEEQQYEIEYQIRTEIDNAFSGVHVQLAKWIKRDGNKNDKVIQAAYKESEVYTRGYIGATNESYVATEREGMKNMTFELMERKVQ